MFNFSPHEYFDSCESSDFSSSATASASASLSSSDTVSRNEKPTFYVPHQQPHDQVIYPLLNSGYPYLPPATYPHVYPYFY